MTESEKDGGGAIMPQTLANDASPLETVREVVESAAVDRVFGTPIAQDGLTVIPVARFSGGGGGGSGNAPADEDEGAVAGGTGGGVGMMAKPLGVFVVKDGDVRWRPAIDINKIVLGGQIVAVVALLTIRTIVKARSHLRALRSREDSRALEEQPGETA
jgi:uncharacterized spore protein YtfJ